MACAGGSRDTPSGGGVRLLFHSCSDSIMKQEITKARGKRLVKFRNCFCGVQAAKFYDGQFLCQRHFESDRARYLQDPTVTAANIKECNARCEKDRYARLKAAGLCVTCGKLPSYFGCLRCSQCQEKRRKLHYASRGARLDGPHHWKIANQVFFSSYENAKPTKLSKDITT